MWECDYAGEPVNRRLLFLQFMKRIWIVLLGTIAGIVAVAGLYYMSRMVFGAGRTYQAEDVYYLDYAESAYKDEYVYFNHYTWNEIIHMDYFMNRIYEECGNKYSREEIAAGVAATLDSDVRFVYVRCTTETPEKSLALSAAARKAMEGYADLQKEINSVQPVKTAESTKDSTNLRMTTAAILGAVIGFLASVVGLLICLISDSSVYLPETLEKRYGIPCLGAPSMPEFAVNVENLKNKYSRITLIPAETTGNQIEEKTAVLFGDGVKSASNPVAVPEQINALSDTAVVIAVKAGAHNGRMLDRTLDQLKRFDIAVKAFVLIDEDSSFISHYYKK